MLALTLLALAGCSTNESKPSIVRKPLPKAPGPASTARAVPRQTFTPPSAANGAAKPGSTNNVALTNAPDITNPVTARPPDASNSVPTNVPVPEVNLYLHPGTTEWVDIAKWSAGENVRFLSQTNMGSKRFQLRSQHGAFTVMSGSQTAYWNGQGLMLGFAPQWSHNHPYLHRSDLQHTVIPLLSKGLPGSHEGKVLVIDPGHGGVQPGSRTVVGNRLEKELTLDWALRARALLTNQGWRVYLTRSNDVDVALTNRVALAEKLHADLFVSLHFNSFANPEYAGLETYCMTPAGMPSNLVRGSEDHMALPNNAYDDENLCWAVRLHQALIQETHAPDRAVRRARFMAVLRNQKCPAVLIEGGYLSNRSEAAKLVSEAYRQQLAEGLVKALTKHE